MSRTRHRSAIGRHTVCRERGRCWNVGPHPLTSCRSHSEAEAPINAPAAVKRSSRAHRVLLVDDNKDVAEPALTSLTLQGSRLQPPISYRDYERVIVGRA